MRKIAPSKLSAPVIELIVAATYAIVMIGTGLLGFLLGWLPTWLSVVVIAFGGAWAYSVVRRWVGRRPQQLQGNETDDPTFAGNPPAVAWLRWAAEALIPIAISIAAILFDLSWIVIGPLLVIGVILVVSFEFALTVREMRRNDDERIY